MPLPLAYIHTRRTQLVQSHFVMPICLGGGRTGYKLGAWNGGMRRNYSCICRNEQITFMADWTSRVCGQQSRPTHTQAHRRAHKHDEGVCVCADCRGSQALACVLGLTMSKTVYAPTPSHCLPCAYTMAKSRTHRSIVALSPRSTHPSSPSH